MTASGIHLARLAPLGPFNILFVQFPGHWRNWRMYGVNRRCPYCPHDVPNPGYRSTSSCQGFPARISLADVSRKRKERTPPIRNGSGSWRAGPSSNSQYSLSFAGARLPACSSRPTRIVRSRPAELCYSNIENPILIRYSNVGL